MATLLTSGTTVRAEPGGVAFQVEDLLGEGGQGEVYRVRRDNQAMALKWYFARYATPEQRDILQMLIRKAPPSPDFLWPLHLAQRTTEDFGYVMPLREGRFKSIWAFLSRRVETSFRALTMAGMKLAHAFLQVHAQGLCYRDISNNNVCFDPKTGDISICDNDNVSVDNKKATTIWGTPRFMAPEVVSGRAWPNTQTDQFSLAVLLFYLFVRHHPLDGKKEAAIHCMDAPAMTQLYGNDAVFIFDPNDDSNRPVSGLHDNALALWPLFPAFFRDLFTRTFTIGIHQPTQRVVESEWRLGMSRLRDCIVYCHACARENFHDPFGPATAPTCWNCRRTIVLPLWLEIVHGPTTRLGVYLNHDVRLYPHHLSPNRRFDFSQPLAEVAQHPQDPNLWGLRNLSQVKWVMQNTDGKAQEVEPGKSVALVPERLVNFGLAQGRFRQVNGAGRAPETTLEPMTRSPTRTGE